MATERLIRSVLLAVLIVLVAVPLGFICLQALFPQFGAGDVTFGGARLLKELAAPPTLGLIANTVMLGCGVCLGCLLVGVPLGILRALAPPPGARVWDVLLLTPFMLPPYMASIGWILVLQPRGYLQQLTGANAAGFLFSLPGLVFIMTMHLFPVVYFAVARAVEAASGRLGTVARVFGAGPFAEFRAVTLPLALPAIVGSLLLVFAATIEEYGTPATLAPQTGFVVLSTAIDRKVADWPIDLAGASTLSLVLVLLAGATFLLQRRMIGRRSFEVVTGRPQDLRPKLRSPLIRLLLFAIFGLVLLASACLPLFGIVATASTRTISGGLTASNLTLEHFRALAGDGEGALGAIGFSFTLAFLTACFTAVIAVGAALLLRGRDTTQSRLVALLTAVPNAVPGIVVSVGLILAWNQSWLPFTVYATPAMLVLAYSCILIPYPVRYAASALAQLGASLEPAARVAGASSLTAVVRILLPLMLPSLVAAMMLVFAVAARELVASILLAPVGATTISTFIWKQFEQGSLGIGMAMGTVAILLTLATMGAVGLLGRRHLNLH